MAPKKNAWRCLVDEGDYSSLFLGNGARKMLDGAVLTHPVGNPKRKV
jgi:hypothetical protein